MRKGFLAVLVIAGVGLLIAGIMTLKSPGGNSALVGKTTLVAGSSSLVAVGSPAPDFEIAYASGDTTRLSDLKGRPVIVNFWATWCPPCKAEMPDLQQAFEDHKANGLEIVAVNAGQESASTVAGFAAKYGLTFRIALDESGAVSTRYQVNGIPASFFIDRQGIVQDIYVGQLLPGDIEQRIQLIQ